MDKPTCKPCNRCGEIKPLSSFHKGNGLHGLKTYCIPCRSATRSPDKYSPAHYAATREIRLVRKAAYHARLVARTSVQLAADQARLRPDGIKRCGRCQEWQPLSEFYPNLNMADGLTARCVPCLRARRSGLVTSAVLEWWAANGMRPDACTYCGAAVNYLGRNPDAEPMHVDHIFPQSRGGTDNPENLAPSCGQCNRSKGVRSLAEWIDAAA